MVLGITDELEGVSTERELQPDLFHVWPDNIESLSVFLALSTQWEQIVDDGDFVRTRIIYETFDTVVERLGGIPRRAWNRIFADIQLMERAALRVLNEARLERRKREAEEREREKRSRSRD